jgi:hypothetical protein
MKTTVRRVAEPINERDDALFQEGLGQIHSATKPQPQWDDRHGETATSGGLSFIVNSPSSFPQGDHWIDFGRSPGGEVTSQKGHGK